MVHKIKKNKRPYIAFAAQVPANPGCFRREPNDLFDQNDLHKLNLDIFLPPKVDSHALSVRLTVMFSSLLSEWNLHLRKQAHQAL